MKKLFAFSAIAFAMALLVPSTGAQDKVKLPEGKEIYVQQDWKDMDLYSPDSEWSYTRMYCTPNIAVMWQKGFGQDPSKTPELEGHDMTFNPKALADKLESFYKVYTDDMKFVLPGSKAEKYRMMCFVNYGLDGTAYGGSVDDVIGGLWVTPLRLKDPTLNVLAHELGHCFQSQIMCDGTGEAWGGSGFFEMTSQWMLWTVNPNWQTDEKYHWDAWNTLTHKAFLAGDNIYHSPYVIEYWATKRGLSSIADLYRAGKRGEDPVMTYKRLYGLDQKAFNDEMFDACRHFVNWDFDRVWNESRPYANKNVTKLDTLENGWLRVDPSNCPENYGFNAIPMPLPKNGRPVRVEFKGIAGEDGYAKVHLDKAGWRYGFVGVLKNGKSVYGKMNRFDHGTISFNSSEGDLQYLWLVVMGAPQEHWMNPFNWNRDQEPEPDAQWPYQIRIK